MTGIDSGKCLIYAFCLRYPIGRDEEKEKEREREI